MINKAKVFIILTIVTLLIASCNVNSNNKSNNNCNNVNQNDSNKYKASYLESFVNIIKENDNKAFKEYVSSSGLIIIRNYVSGGNGSRGKNIRNFVTRDKLPPNLNFEIAGEIPLCFSDIFINTINLDIEGIQVAEIDNLQFGFLDDGNINNVHPPTKLVIETCSKMLIYSNEQEYGTRIFSLSERELVLTESVLINKVAVGAWLVFEKKFGQYFLRAIIDLR